MTSFIYRLKKQITHGWQWGYRNILTRRVPHALLSWYYLLPNSSDAIKSHRNVLLHAWPKLPRPAWWCILLYSYLGWYLLFAWPRILKAWHRHRVYVCAKHGISYAKQLGQLWMVAYLHAIPPRFYYRFRLYQYDQFRWLDFVYTNELPHWHYLMSPNMSERSRRLMQDKAFMAEEFGRKGIPVVETLLFLEKGFSVSDRLLAQLNRSLFIKPVRGSRMRGCFEYHMSASVGELRHVGTDEPCLLSPLSYLNSLLKEQAFIVQPCLDNSDSVAGVLGDRALCTIRLVTKFSFGEIKIVSAVYEVPDLNEVCSISLKEGKVAIAGSVGASKASHCFEELALSNWSDILSSAKNSHEELPDVRYIGWDFAISSDGPLLLEGNINFGVEKHQLEQPMLCSLAYCSVI